MEGRATRISDLETVGPEVRNARHCFPVPSVASCRLTLALVLTVIAAGVGCNRGGITPIQTAFNRGVYHYSIGQYDEAIHEYRKQLRQSPNDQRARFNLAVALEAKARTVEGEAATRLRDEARTEYGGVLQRDPAHLRANINLAALEYERGQGKAAIQRLEQTIERHPRVVLPRTALAAIHLQQSDMATAEEILNAALRIDPASADANMLLGDCLKVQGRLEDAAGAYRRALNTNKEDVASLMALAKLEAQRKNRREALALLQRLLYVDRDHWEAHLMVAEVARSDGQLQRAAYHLWTSQTLDHQRPPGTTTPDYAIRLRELYRQLLEEKSAAAGQ